MIQALLADRFKLEFHRVTRILPEYALVVAKGGPKLQAAADGDANNGSSSQDDRSTKGWGLTISNLANMLLSAVEAPVLDRTGLEGKHNFILEFAPLLGAPKEGETAPDIFSVLQEQRWAETGSHQGAGGDSGGGPRGEAGRKLTGVAAHCRPTAAAVDTGARMYV
jgi:uncharacterized protein (TIGR03435 family)